MGYGRSKQNFSTHLLGLSQHLPRGYHHSLSSLTIARPPDPAMGKDIARIWFSEKKMSTLAGRLFAVARRGPDARRIRGPSRALTPGGRRSIGALPSSTGWRTTSAPLSAGKSPAHLADVAEPPKVIQFCT